MALRAPRLWPKPLFPTLCPPCPTLSMPALLGARAGSQAPLPAGGGLHAGGVVAPPVQGEALLQLFSWLFKHTVLPGRNCGRQRPPRRCLGREQVPRASAGILQGNRRGFKGFAGCRWFPCSIFLLPSLREAALSTLCGWEGCGGEDALSGAWLYTECCWWGRAQQAHAAQVSSSDVLLRSRALLCGFLCLLFPPAWASRQRLDCHLCK